MKNEMTTADPLVIDAKPIAPISIIQGIFTLASTNEATWTRCQTS